MESNAVPRRNRTRRRSPAHHAGSRSIESLEPRTLFAAIKIMPVGDSITESFTTHASYRFWLFNKLKTAGYDVDFVGTMTGVNGGPPLYPNFDQNHEGHSGWRADEIQANMVGWATSAQPDIVLLHAGTNDVEQGQSNSSTINEISATIDNLRSVRPNAIILLAQVIPENGFATQINALNGLIATLAGQKNTAQSPVILVNQNAGFDVAQDTYDGVHPDESGEIKMSDKWFSALVPVLTAPTPPAKVFLSDLQWTTATNGWGGVERDRSNGESGAADGTTLRLNNVSYSKGLGVHAESDITYNITGHNYIEFRSDAGVDDEVGNSGSVVFQVYVDNVLRFSSPTLTGAGTTQQVVVAVNGASTLRLRVTDSGNGNGNTFDHADWANAKMIAGTPIHVTNASFSYQSQQSLALQFDANVSTSLTAADLVLQNLTTSSVVPTGSIHLIYSPNMASFTFTGILASGNYRLTLPFDSVQDAMGNHLSGDYVFDFFILAGDANHDRIVNIADLRALAANFGQSGKLFSDGDFDYDGDVDRDDLAILSQNWGTSLPPLPPPAATLDLVATSVRRPFAERHVYLP